MHALVLVVVPSGLSGLLDCWDCRSRSGAVFWKLLLMMFRTRNRSCRPPPSSTTPHPSHSICSPKTFDATCAPFRTRRVYVQVWHSLSSVRRRRRSAYVRNISTGEIPIYILGDGSSDRVRGMLARRRCDDVTRTYVLGLLPLARTSEWL